MWKCPKCGREFRNTNQDHYCGEAPKTIDEYILAQDEEHRPELFELRRILKESLPEAEEKIVWSMPTFRKGHNICHFAAFRKHIGFYPGEEAVKAFSDALAGYQTNKGTIRIPYGKLDAGLIAEIARWCDAAGNHA